jgi:hypothetical protein
MEYGRVEQIVREAAELASKKRSEKGLPPLPHTTPYTLRRTYISITLVAYQNQPICRSFSSGAYRDRTGDLLLAKQALSQLS